MSKLREEELDLAAGFALGVLSEADQRRLESLLAAGHPELETAVREMSEAAGMLAHGTEQAGPSAALRTRVLAAAKASPHAPGGGAPPGRVLAMPARRTALAWNAALGWAAAAVLLAVSYLSFSAANRAQNELRAVQEDLKSIRQSLADERKWAAVLTSPAARAVKLGVTPVGDAKLGARAAYDPTTQHAILIFENFAAPTGRDYELWAIRGGKPASLGVIHADARGRAVMELDQVGEASQLGAFAVSLEPAGGSPHADAPSGPVVMLGKLAG